MLKVYRDTKGLTSLRVKPHAVLIPGLILLHLKYTCNIYKKNSNNKKKTGITSYVILAWMHVHSVRCLPPPPPHRSLFLLEHHINHSTTNEHIGPVRFAVRVKLSTNHRLPNADNSANMKYGNAWYELMKQMYHTRVDHSRFASDPPPYPSLSLVRGPVVPEPRHKVQPDGQLRQVRGQERVAVFTGGHRLALIQTQPELAGV